MTNQTPIDGTGDEFAQDFHTMRSQMTPSRQALARLNEAVAELDGGGVSATKHSTGAALPTGSPSSSPRRSRRPRRWTRQLTGAFAGGVLAAGLAGSMIVSGLGGHSALTGPSAPQTVSSPATQTLAPTGSDQSGSSSTSGSVFSRPSDYQAVYAAITSLTQGRSQ
ncbi:MAG: hypothetical protein LBV00_10005, partial [Propionibacteriaceae bacterium]|nr:hypothetical protein [Propionibacteriaceae bacterium]